MIIFFIVGSIVGAVIMAVFGGIKFFTYKEEVNLLKDTITRLETLNSNLIYNSFIQEGELK